MVEQAAKRGRRANSSNPTLKRQDAAIAASMSTMIYWGFSRDVALKAVAAACHKAFTRRLSADAIKKIWEREAWSYGQQRTPKFGRISLEWRLKNQPPDAVEMPPVDVAARLIANAGSWGADWEELRSTRLRGDAPLTAKAHDEAVKFRLRLVKDKTG